MPAARVAPSVVLAEEREDEDDELHEAARPIVEGVDTQALLDVADGLEEQRRCDEAASLYRRALQQEPADPRSLHGLARCLIELTHTREAIEVYETLMATDPRYRNYAAALEIYRELHSAREGYVLAHIADVCINLQDYPQALHYGELARDAVRHTGPKQRNATAAQHRHALAAQAKLPARLCAFRNRHFRASAVKRGDFDVSTQ